MTPMDAPQAPQATAVPTDQPTDRAVLEFLAWRYDRLHMLFQFALAALIILSGGLNVFLVKQMIDVRTLLPQQREATIRFAMDFHKRDDQTIRSFVTRLQQFAATNPDLQPILDHHKPNLTAYFLPVPQKVAPSAPAGSNAGKK